MIAALDVKGIIFMLDLLDRKIRQMHAALAGLSSDDLSRIQPKLTITEYYKKIEMDFNDSSNEIELRNIASLLVANIASIKDHLKAWCKKRNVKFEGDELINSNRSVALIHDLWNVDKHAELNTTPRSGHTPKLSNLRRVLALTTASVQGSGVFMTLNLKTGHPEVGTFGADGGTAKLTLIADIVDENGFLLGEFSRVCGEAVEAWSKSLANAGVDIYYI